MELPRVGLCMDLDDFGQLIKGQCGSTVPPSLVGYDS